MAINEIRISPNFLLSEFACHEGQEVKLDPDLVRKLQALRDKLGRPIIINSGYRTPEYNKKVGGSPNSQHMLGKAADIRVPGMTPEQVAKAAEAVGFNGIGLYNTFTHVDVRGWRARWDERK